MEAQTTLIGQVEVDSDYLYEQARDREQERIADKINAMDISDLITLLSDRIFDEIKKERADKKLTGLLPRTATSKLYAKEIFDLAYEVDSMEVSDLAYDLTRDNQP